MKSVKWVGSWSQRLSAHTTSPYYPPHYSFHSPHLKAGRVPRNNQLGVTRDIVLSTLRHIHTVSPHFLSPTWKQAESPGTSSWM